MYLNLRIVDLLARVQHVILFFSNFPTSGKMLDIIYDKSRPSMFVYLCMSTRTSEISVGHDI